MNNLLPVFTFLTSEETAQSFLYQCYQRIPDIKESDMEKQSYLNCQSFMYYLDHGRKLYETGGNVDILFQPTLFFYGMSHFMKAILLTERPYYPESTKMLSHGVSSRKRKKKQYTFMEDEVKLQHHGLLPYYAKHILHMEQWPFQKVKMKTMFSLIPELHVLFELNHDRQLFKIGQTKENALYFPATIIDRYFMTEHYFIKYIRVFLPNIKDVHVTKDHIIIYLTDFLDRHDIYNRPFFIDNKEAIYFPAQRENCFPISASIIHYLLLYNLSMLSRYEAGWWGDLIANKADMDYPFISQYLQVISQKIPKQFHSHLAWIFHQHRNSLSNR